MTNLEKPNRALLKTKTESKHVFILYYCVWINPELHIDTLWRVLWLNEPVTGSFSWKVFVCCRFVLVTEHSAWSLSACCSMKPHFSNCHLWLSEFSSLHDDEWQARSIALFSFGAASTGWTPQWSKGSTGYGSTSSLDMQSWIICSDDSRTNVFCHMFVSEFWNTRLSSYACQWRFHSQRTDSVVAHVNKHLIRWLNAALVHSSGEQQTSDRAAQHSANRLRQKEEGDHNWIWRLLRWPDVWDGWGQDIATHSTRYGDTVFTVTTHISLHVRQHTAEQSHEATDEYFIILFISKIFFSCNLVVAASNLVSIHLMFSHDTRHKKCNNHHQSSP